jgi:predicted RNA-binding protein with PIN domain
MPRARWIIDGYSLLHRDPALAPLLKSQLQRARDALVRNVDRAAAAEHAHATIVFDGRTGGTTEEKATTHVVVVFSPSHQTADTVIERMVHDDPAPSTLTVITSDRMERETVTAAGADAMSCAAFLDLAAESARHVAKAVGRTRQPGARRTLGDHFPRE